MSSHKVSAAAARWCPSGALGGRRKLWTNSGPFPDRCRTVSGVKTQPGNDPSRFQTRAVVRKPSGNGPDWSQHSATTKGLRRTPASSGSSNSLDVARRKLQFLLSYDMMRKPLEGHEKLQTLAQRNLYFKLKPYQIICKRP